MYPSTLLVPRRKTCILDMPILPTRWGSWSLIESTIIRLASSMISASLGFLLNMSRRPFLLILRSGIPAMGNLPAYFSMRYIPPRTTTANIIVCFIIASWIAAAISARSCSMSEWPVWSTPKPVMLLHPAHGGLPMQPIPRTWYISRSFHTETALETELMLLSFFSTPFSLLAGTYPSTIHQ